MNLRDLLELWYGGGLWLAAAAGVAIAALVAWAAAARGDSWRAGCLALIGAATVLPSVVSWVFGEQNPHELEPGGARTAATLAMFFGIAGIAGLAICATAYFARRRFPWPLAATGAAAVAVLLVAPSVVALANGFQDGELSAAETAARVEEGLPETQPAQQAAEAAEPAQVLSVEGTDVAITLDGDEGEPEAPAGEEDGPLADGPVAAVGAWFEATGQDYAGDCILADPAVDAFRQCTAVYSVSAVIWLFVSGPTFSPYDRWIFVEQISGQWRVYATAPLSQEDFASAEVPWPDESPPFEASGIGLEPGTLAVVTATGSCFNLQSLPTFASLQTICLDDGTAVEVLGSEVGGGYVWYETVDGWIAGPWLLVLTP